MSSDRYRLSFDAVAEAYERARPGYADDALAWVAARLPFGRVLDLAAGTGKLTRQLVGLAADVVAVEPGVEMRRVLKRVVPRIETLAGSAEAIPLRDASVDAIAVGQAFHWFRVEEALREMHRVLRPGGGIALFWNEWDDSDPLLHALNELVESLRPEGAHNGHQREALERSPLFGGFEKQQFRHVEELPPSVVVERVSSVSAFAAAEHDVRDRKLALVRELVGHRVVSFPMTTTVLVANRV